MPADKMTRPIPGTLITRVVRLGQPRPLRAGAERQLDRMDIIPIRALSISLPIARITLRGCPRWPPSSRPQRHCRPSGSPNVWGTSPWGRKGDTRVGHANGELPGEAGRQRRSAVRPCRACRSGAGVMAVSVEPLRDREACEHALQEIDILCWRPVPYGRVRDLILGVASKKPFASSAS